MWLMDYEGRWHESSARHPESFVVLGPEVYQNACMRWGGARNHYGEPRFRLVELTSRYQLSGGREITFLDSHGNFQKTTEETEVLLPRYHVGKEYHKALVLEMWHDARWYHQHGYGAQPETEFSGTGKAFRNVEPIWSDGGYEAIWNGIQTPFVFLRTMPISMIEWMLFVVKIRLGVRADQLARLAREREAAQEMKDREWKAEHLISKLPAYLEPAVSYAGMDAKGVL